MDVAGQQDGPDKTRLPRDMGRRFLIKSEQLTYVDNRKVCVDLLSLKQYYLPWQGNFYRARLIRNYKFIWKYKL